MRSATCIEIIISADQYDFNPRAPCGARQWVVRALASSYPFQSTRSMRSATLNDPDLSELTVISIHALHAERDPIGQ